MQKKEEMRKRKIRTKSEGEVRTRIWDAHRSCWQQPEPEVWLILQDPWTRRGGVEIMEREL